MTETGYYEQSYPPSLWAPVPPPVVHATGGTAGTPGTWSPVGSTPPATAADLIAGIPNAVVATPATAWAGGAYMQTMEFGAAGRASWTGTTWVGGAAPAVEEPEPDPPPEDEPPPEDIPEAP